MQITIKSANKQNQKLADKVTLILILASMLAIALYASAVQAGAGGTAEFGTIQTTISGWMKGALGKVLALSSLGVGLGVGVVKQSIMAFVLGVGMAVSTYYGPDVLESVVSAAIVPVKLAAVLL